MLPQTSRTGGGFPRMADDDVEDGHAGFERSPSGRWWGMGRQPRVEAFAGVEGGQGRQTRGRRRANMERGAGVKKINQRLLKWHCNIFTSYTSRGKRKTKRRLQETSTPHPGCFYLEAKNKQKKNEKKRKNEKRKASEANRHIKDTFKGGEEDFFATGFR